MLQERPDVTRSRHPGAARATRRRRAPSRLSTIYRRNGVEAFTDLATAKEVAQATPGSRHEVMKNIEKMQRAPGTTTTGPLFARAVETLKTQESLEVAERRPALHAAPPDPQPGEVPGLPRQRSPGARGGARRDLDGAGLRRGPAPPQPADPHRGADDRSPRRPSSTSPCAASSSGRSPRSPARRPARRRAATSRRGRPAGARDEIGELGGAFNEMTSRLARAHTELATQEHGAGDRPAEPPGVAAAAGAARAAQGRAVEVRPRGRQAAPRAEPERDRAGEADRRGLGALPRHRRLHEALRAARARSGSTSSCRPTSRAFWRSSRATTAT